ncbi:HEAT repeat domain-containing protein [Candidatus Neptunochlamydia vexilliferae]|uniref:Serine protease n=1 Tax=Candidatus Neptunichlamydia vexilliferae TaxID=1651774 RepID=A0ABS0AYN8_9BACT|nr:HEAT repeat domain-containing protein [Candidatus Neptunochlamydia vexilliferae]MBF5059079.1 hypothetical protein [Candidatus Neptunochlamydia vexilliferae]
MASSSSSSSSCSSFNPQDYQIEKPKPPPKTITTTLERDKIHKLSKQKRWVVCQVCPGNSDERGSGCLIGGRLLLTNYHVLPNKKAVEKGQAVFFMVTKQEHPFGISTAKLLPIELDPNFPLIQSKNNMPTPTSLPQPVKEGCLDFTIAALKPHPYLSEVQDKVFSIFKKVSIKKNDPIHVLQYPHEMDSKTLISGDLKEDTGYITKKNTHDLEHSADTKKGSSGSSIIDKNGNLIALHYRARRGVLITQIAASLTTEEKNRIEELSKEKFETNTPQKKAFSKALKNYYLAHNQLTVLRLKTGGEFEFKLPIEKIFVRLGIITQKKRKERDQSLDKHSGQLTVEDGRYPTHETIFEQKENIEIETLFDHESFKKENTQKNYSDPKDLKDKSVYIQGAAGIGKSTLCHYIAYQWAKNGLWKEHFSHIIWIPLRNLTLEKYPPSKDYTLYDLIIREYKGQADLEPFRKALEDPNLPQKTLLILDGYDELSSDAEGNSSLGKAFKKLKEHFPHTLITSRPGPCSFKRSCNLELLGFDREGIKRYINNFFTQAQSELQKQKLENFLDSSSYAMSLAHIPINLTLLCALFNDDPKVFDAVTPVTLTSIYDRILNQMYKWFLLKKIGKGESKQRKGNILTDNNLRKNREVYDIVEAFEKLANYAMNTNTLYIQKAKIERIINHKYTIEELSQIGLLRIPEGGSRGYFIHLTFQEFLTASKIANSYLDGLKHEECQRFVSENKFNPRYALIFRMIAGYLSCRSLEDDDYLPALKDFFEDLFSKPRDLAKSYELTLFANCFEECDGTQIDQYDDFIKEVVKYIKVAPTQEMRLHILHRNTKLLHNKKVLKVFQGWFKDAQKHEEAISLVHRLAAVNQSIPDEFFSKLMEMAFDQSFSWDVRLKAANALLEISKEGDDKLKQTIYFDDAAIVMRNVAVALGGISKKLCAQQVDLFLAALSDEGFSYAGDEVAAVLVKIAKEGPDQASKVCKKLVEMVLNKEINLPDKKRAVAVLEEIGKEEHNLPQNELEDLKKMVLNQDLNLDYRWIATKTLLGIGKGDNLQAFEPLKALVDIFTDKDQDRYLRESAAILIGKAGAEGYCLPQIALKELTATALDKNCHLDFRWVATETLGEVVKGRDHPQANKALEGLLVMLQQEESNDYAQKNATTILQRIIKGRYDISCRVLKSLKKVKDKKLCISIKTFAMEEIVKGGKEISSEALKALVEMVKDSTLDSSARGSAASVLGEIGKGEKEGSSEALKALVEMVKDSTLDSSARGRAASVLGEIVKGGKEVSSEALKALVEMVKDRTLNSYARGRAAEALGEIGKGRKEGSSEAIKALVEMVKDSTLNSYDQVRAAEALGEIVKGGKEVSSEALKALVEMVKDRTFGSSVRGSAAEVLVEIGKEGKEGSSEAIKALVEMVKDRTLDSYARLRAAKALVEIKGGREISSEAFNALEELIKDRTLNWYVRLSGAYALREIDKGRKEVSSEALKALVEMVKDRTLNSYARGRAAEALGEIVKGGKEVSSEAIKALVEMVKDSTLDSYARGRAAEALEEIVKGGKEVSSEAIKALVEMVKDRTLNSYARGRAAEALGEIVKGGKEVSSEALKALEAMVKDSTLDSYDRLRAASALGEIVKGGKEVSSEAIKALVEMVKDSTLDSSARTRAAEALGEIVKGGKESSSEALKALVEMVKDSTLDSYARRSAAYVLVEIGKGGKESSSEALKALVEMVKDRTLNSYARTRAAEALPKMDLSFLSFLETSRISCLDIAQVCAIKQQSLFILENKVVISNKHSTESFAIDNSSIKELKEVKILDLFSHKKNTGSAKKIIQTDIAKLATSKPSVSNSSSILNNASPINTHPNLSSVHDFTSELTAIENKQKQISVYELQELERSIKTSNLPDSQKQSLLARVEKIHSGMSGSSSSNK